MAPRGRRPRKVGLGRMDAALDAMRPLGFSDALVRKTVKDLLKVYGGDEGWGFIEEASYKVLVDTILEGQEQCEPEVCLLKRVRSSGVRTGLTMPPRGRPRKVGLRRMDAAIDAMKLLGFPKELVEKKVKNLLKVYDGDQGWVFIEEDSYKLLIETILEEQEKDSSKDDSSNEEARGGTDAQSSAAGPSEVPDDAEPSVAGFSGGVSNDTEPSAAGLSGGVLDDGKPSTAGPASGGLQLMCSEPDVLDTALQTYETEGQSYLLPAEVEGRGKRNLTLDNESCPKRMNRIGNTDGNSGVATYLGNSLFHSPLAVDNSGELVDNLPKKRRKRCHGWISSDDEDDFLVELTPAISPRHVKNMIDVTERQRKRKTRWDVRPEDM
ncbi:hypothetical protein L1049_012069 [Liquidambar formosana]|uniref:WIYLD domain-containing protein n=1 Tax=Liquidambar formosana TaxID=63359 RepID=A0AAP0RSE6_LIQFO